MEALRRRGHDVLTCQQTGRANLGIDDDVVLADAMKFGRIILTQNCGDFKNLHQQDLLHVGTVNCSYDPDTEGHALRIEEAILKEPEGGRLLICVNRPNLGGMFRSRKS